MPKFIEVHETIINIVDIRRVEFITDDVYMGLFKDLNRKIVTDNTPIEFAKIFTFDGEEFHMVLDLYLPQDGEDEEAWRHRNMAYINMMVSELKSVLLPIQVTNKEYEFF